MPWNIRFWRRCRQASWPFGAESDVCCSRGVSEWVGGPELIARVFEIPNRRAGESMRHGKEQQGKVAPLPTTFFRSATSDTAPKGT